MALSGRGQKLAQPNDGLLIWKILADLYDAETNTSGYVSLGVAENTLMHETLSDHIKNNIDVPNHAFTYGDGPTGSKRLKSALASFLTKHLKPVTAIKPSHIIVTNGVTSALEHLAFLLGNPGEGFLLGQPHYGAFIPDLSLRSETFVATVAFGGVDPFHIDAVKAYEDVLLSCRQRGQKIAGLIVCNPHNPLGRCYPEQTLVALMRLCQKYEIHFICDEIYALSVWKNDVDVDVPATPFQSCLSIDPQGIIDPSRINVVWGTSKDFGANGIRLGALISQHNSALHSALVPVTLYSSPSSISDHITANILEDDRWVESYVDENRQKLSEHYSFATRWAKENNIAYAHGVNAAFFLWVDLGSAYRARHADEKIENITDEVMGALLKKRIFLASGKTFGSEVPGWFRIVFSHRKELLQEGLNRIKQALDDSPHTEIHKN